jgi:hypothetical protein
MINVYYSPWHHLSVYDDRFLTYKDPEWLLENVISQSEKLNLTDNFFKCPAVIEQLKNTLVLKNTSDVHVKFENDHYQNLLQNPKLSSHVLINVKQPSVKNQRTINYSTNWVFFADKPLQMSTSVPFMHRVEHSKYGYYVPGIYDISKWFRPIEYAFQMWPDTNEFKSFEDEPLLYAKFHTNEKIKLHKFYMTKEIMDISLSCMGVKKFSNTKALDSLYKLFTSNNFDNKLLTKIKESVLV